MYLISVCSNTPQNASVVFLYRRPTVSVRGRLRVPHHHHDLHRYERVQVIITKPTNDPSNTNTMNSHVDRQPVLFVTLLKSVRDQALNVTFFNFHIVHNNLVTTRNLLQYHFASVLLRLTHNLTEFVRFIYLFNIYQSHSPLSNIDTRNAQTTPYRNTEIQNKTTYIPQVLSSCRAGNHTYRPSNLLSQVP